MWSCRGDLPSPVACVYSGPGAGERSVASAKEALRASVSQAVQVQSLDAASLLAGHWTASCMLLVMPGGADLPYCRDLNGLGNSLIRAFVEAGGAYLGLCAGAYYACRRIEFEMGSRLQVEGERELAFFPGLARGGIYSGFDYASEGGSRAAPLTFLPCNVAYGAGIPATPDSKVACSSDEGMSPAQLSKSNADTSSASKHHHPSLLTAAAPAMHTQPDQSPADQPLGIEQLQECVPLIEASMRDGWHQCVDYCNGGPGFHHAASLADSPDQLISQVQASACTADIHEARTELPTSQKRRRNADEPQHPAENSQPVCSKPAAALQSMPPAFADSDSRGQNPQQLDSASEASHLSPSVANHSYLTYDPASDTKPPVTPAAGMLSPDSSPHAHQQDTIGQAAAVLADCAPRANSDASSGQIKVLAHFNDFPGTPAAVQCRVGCGVAVLCATHPEMAPHWLQSACSCNQQLPGRSSSSRSSSPRNSRWTDPQVDDAAGVAKHPSSQCNACLVRIRLEASKRERQNFWKMLLVQSGLSDWLRP
ncbi:hypothetical protein WJX74_010003 [Apatococcus lobatus]|uniref:Biotin-protein ligase N-terminal domain-containing protein n=1 Tax=Apatococcus lobatus TaxID=904363 RepID=A0AAW1QUV0_9CHLO